MPDKNTAADAKAELVDLIRQKRALIDNLANLERQIYLFEGSYLDDTAPYGNIIKGWDRSLLTSSSGSAFSAAAGVNGGGGAGDKRVRRFRDSDRLFSRSSVTSMVSINSHYYDAEKNSAAVSNATFDESQCFEDGSDKLSHDESKIYSAGPSGKKKRKHR